MPCITRRYRSPMTIHYAAILCAEAFERHFRFRARQFVPSRRRAHTAQRLRAHSLPLALVFAQRRGQEFQMVRNSGGNDWHSAKDNG